MTDSKLATFLSSWVFRVITSPHPTHLNCAACSSMTTVPSGNWVESGRAMWSRTNLSQWIIDLVVRVLLMLDFLCGNMQHFWLRQLLLIEFQTIVIVLAWSFWFFFQFPCHVHVGISSVAVLQRKTRAHQKMRYPNVTWRIILYKYLFTTELWHTCTSGILSK